MPQGVGQWEDVSAVSWALNPTWCCHGVAWNEWHMNKTSSPFTAPVSSVPYHFSTSPYSLTCPPLPQLAVTYITLTTGLFLLPHICHWHLLLPIGCPPQQGNLPGWKETRSQTVHPPFIPVSPVVELYLSSVSVLFCIHSFCHNLFSFHSSYASVLSPT